MSRLDLERIHEWATARLQSPRTRRQGRYERLRDTVDAILTKLPQSDD